MQAVATVTVANCFVTVSEITYFLRSGTCLFTYLLAHSLTTATINKLPQDSNERPA